MSVWRAAVVAAFVFTVGSCSWVSEAADECAGWSAAARVPQRVSVVVDATDGLSVPQWFDVWSRIRPLSDEAPPGSSFHVYAVRGGLDRGFRKVGEIMRPPHPCEVNDWFDNRELRRRQWLSRYLRPLRNALASAAVGGVSDSSAILQAVQAAARPLDGGDEIADRKDHESHLVLVSDLMQNGSVSFYRGIPSFNDFRETRLYREVRTRHLRDARLTVLRLPPLREGMNDALVTFWTAYFESLGVRRSRVAFFDIEGPFAAVPEY